MAQQELSFEQAQKELEAILEQISGTAVPLEESVALYAKAADLIALCQQQLARAEVQVEEIDGRLSKLEGQDDL